MKNKFITLVLLTLLFAPNSWSATSYDIKQMTPEVKAALDHRRERFDQLRTLKDQSIVGENNKGYVEVLAKNNDEAKELVEAENKDRQFIYKTIAEQNNLSESSLMTIEAVFAQVQQDKANPGDKIQDDQGMWITKEVK